MDKSSGASVPASDAELLNTIRSGDPAAYAALRGRHAAAAQRLAGQLVSEPAAANDVEARAFTQVLNAIRRGGGPTDAFRPYLLAAVRRAARDSVSGDHAEIPTDEQQIPDPGQPFVDPAAAGLVAAPLVAAFLSLPERWRAVLWHTEIERGTPSEVAPLLGLPAEGVTELAGQARGGLRQAYLQLREADAGAEYADLADTGAPLRSTVAPIVLGDAAAAYLAGLPGAADLPGAGSTVRRSATAGIAVAWLASKLRGSSRQQRALAAGACALLAMFGIAAYALTLSPGTGPVTASGHRTAAGALDPSTPPTATGTPSRRSVKPAARGNRDGSSRQLLDAAVPGASGGHGTGSRRARGDALGWRETTRQWPGRQWPGRQWRGRQWPAWHGLPWHEIPGHELPGHGWLPGRLPTSPRPGAHGPGWPGAGSR
jgi:DNA-directed RNA polymerase specialized sigma24 family protein